MATTGAAWHITNPDNPKPWAWFDPNSVRKIPFDWTDYLADIESTYADHEVIASDVLEVIESTEADGVIVVTVRASGASPGMKDGERYPLTVRMTSADGQVEDQTVFLRITEK